MKFDTTITNLFAIHEAGLSYTTDLDDWAILDYINRCHSQDGASLIDGYVCINYSQLIDDIPLLSVRHKPGLSKRISKLVSLGLLTRSPKYGRAFIKPTDKCLDILIVEEYFGELL